MTHINIVYVSKYLTTIELLSQNIHNINATYKFLDTFPHRSNLTNFTGLNRSNFTSNVDDNQKCKQNITGQYSYITFNT